ncbi:bacterio-opsin activator domain-containing protein [Natrarchaeobaculum aegyptiacum]|uniref:Diguanylate cyclase n=1 Tax=Natrarchaeobaculum aegyptiacum TaxID=745377 RepID=A0A2Z2HX97_9EURY|nr:bacterio-opsin activator domain-containing protein [Natrarchaeobaculum aegyptiacum]ARS89584.1 diguanylate cyclase [Natrarchaeobaculum aegyptiacum]
MHDSIAILVVDPDPSIADHVADRLETAHSGFAVDTVTDGTEALDRLETGAVDCLVADAERGEPPGNVLAERCAECAPSVPCLLVTWGESRSERSGGAIEAGATLVLDLEMGPGGAGDGAGTRDAAREYDQFALLANQLEAAVSAASQPTHPPVPSSAQSGPPDAAEGYERTVETLHDVTRRLMRAETKTEIYRHAVETAGEILDATIAVAYAFDPETGALERAASTSTAGDAAGPPRRFERGEGRIWEAFSAGESATVADGRSITGSGPAVRCELVVPLGAHGAIVVGTAAVRFDELMTELFHVLAANAEAALDRAERELLLREHDRTLTRQNEELTRLNHINEIVREINHGIAQASTRSEIESIVCDRLADTDRYRFAWIATLADDPPEPRSWAGVDATYVDRVREPGAPERRLIDRVLESERVQVVRNVLEDDHWERRRSEALTHGFQTVAGVPLSTDERQYGVLVVHVGGVDSIADAERDVFVELGETIGHALRSVERTRAMLADGHLQLELECRDERLLLNQLAARVPGSVAVEGVLDRGDRIVAFLSTSASVDLTGLADERAAVDGVSLVSDGDDERLYEVTMTAIPLLEVLRSYDARLQTATADDEGSRLVLELTQSAETRSLVDALREVFPETELVAKRETTRMRSAEQLDTYLEERLTERQLEALQAAHYSGFFEWPRESTGEALADALDISAPTYHYHLRAAQRKLVELVFE